MSYGDDGGEHGSGSGLGLLAGVAMVVSGAAPLLRSCDDVAGLGRVARHSDDVRFGARYGDDALDLGRHALPRESRAYAIGDDDLAKVAGVDPADFDHYADDLEPRYARGADRAGRGAGLEEVFFLSRRYDPSLRLLYAAPSNGDDFQRIFGHAPSRSELSSVAQARRNLGNFPQSRPVTNADEVIDALTDGDRSIQVIIGHNEDGMLRLADGSQVDIETLSRKCAENGKLCVVLSCHSNRHIDRTSTTRGIDDAITYHEAERIGRELDSVFKQLAAQPEGPIAFTAVRPPQVDALVKLALERGIAKKRSRDRVTQAGKLVGFGAAGGLILFEMRSE